jgi:DNA-binding NtrC family response regulator
MPPRLLIIEDGSVPNGSMTLSRLKGTVPWERRTWESFSPEELLGSPASLVIAHALPDAKMAVRFFHWLRDNLVQTAVLAVLPELPEPELLQTISEVTDDFVLGPVCEQELELRIARILGTKCTASGEIQDRLMAQMGLAKLVGRHPSFVHAAEQAFLFAGSDAAALITGETGTGKELFAHAIHSLSSRHRGPFIPVDCGALPEHLAENELFGHCRGAFTDARTDQKGLAAMAEGGTLFLDEVDALSLANQAKLLRFLQEGTFRALGADRFTRGNIRIVAATNRCLEEHIRLKQFRSDLYFRLNVLRLQLVPLRERSGDVSILARHFLENECAASKSERKLFSPAALRKLEAYHWPGNVRELLNTVQRTFLTCPGRQILVDHIALPGQAGVRREPTTSWGSFQSAKHSAIEQFERAYIEELMARHHGNITQAAREAGKDRRAFGRMVKKYRAAQQIA